MATYTPNLNLKKPAQNDFVNIEDINNNMDILDGLPARLAFTTLEAANWTGPDAPYEYDLGNSYDGYAVMIMPRYTATDEQLREWNKASIFGSNSTVIYARKSKPTVDLPVTLIYWKVVEENE